MATVTQAISMTPAIRNWDIPGGDYVGPIPYGQITFSDISTILALAAGNVGVYTWSGALPANFVYRLSELRVTLHSSAESQANNLNAAMRTLLTENQVTKKEWSLFNANFRGALTAASYEGINPATTNDVIGNFMTLPDDTGIYDDVVDASAGISILQTTLVDSTGDTTAITASFYARFMMYTVSQFRNGSMYAPINL